MSDNAVYRGVHNFAKPPPDRITIGYQTIAAARQVWMLASGTGKEQAFRESLAPNGKTPFARVLSLREWNEDFYGYCGLNSGTRILPVRISRARRPCHYGSFCFNFNNGSNRSPIFSTRFSTSSERKFSRSASFFFNADLTSSHSTGVETVGCSFARRE